MKKTRQISIPVDDETHDRIVVAAVRAHRTVAGFVRAVVEERLAREDVAHG